MGSLKISLPVPFLCINYHFAADMSHLWVHGAMVRVRLSTADVRTAVLQRNKQRRQEPGNYRTKQNKNKSDPPADKPTSSLFCRERPLTSKHAHRFGPPTLQSWHWPWKQMEAVNLETDVRVWSEAKLRNRNEEWGFEWLGITSSQSIFSSQTFCLFKSSTKMKNYKKILIHIRLSCS